MQLPAGRFGYPADWVPSRCCMAGPAETPVLLVAGGVAATQAEDIDTFMRLPADRFKSPLRWLYGFDDYSVGYLGYIPLII